MPVCCELGHGDRLGGGALGVSEDRQRVLGAESAWVRAEFVLHGEDDVVGVGQTARALLDQFGRRQHLQRGGAWVGPDHVADRRGGRAIVETQRVQIQILGGLRESVSGVGSVVPPRMIAVSLPESGSSASPNAAAAVSTDVSTSTPPRCPPATRTAANQTRDHALRPLQFRSNGFSRK